MLLLNALRPRVGRLVRADQQQWFLVWHRYTGAPRPFLDTVIVVPSSHRPHRVAAAAGVALSTVGVAGASASGPAPRAALRAVPVSSAGTSEAAASPGTRLWAKLYNGSGADPDQANTVAVSPNGSTVYVTGQSVAALNEPMAVARHCVNCARMRPSGKVNRHTRPPCRLAA